MVYQEKHNQLRSEVSELQAQIVSLTSKCEEAETRAEREKVGVVLCGDIFFLSTLVVMQSRFEAQRDQHNRAVEEWGKERASLTYQVHSIHFRIHPCMH